MTLLKTAGYGSNPNEDEVGGSLLTYINNLFKGRPLTLKSGTDAYMGTATLVAGTKTVANKAVRTGDEILLFHKTPGGTPGFLSQGTIVDKTSFVINSSSNTDTSVVRWVIARAAS